MTAVAFDVHGTPAPQGSKRHVGRGIMVESSKKLKPWREAVKWAALAAVGCPPAFPNGPVDIEITLYFPRPKSHYGTGRNSQRLREDAPKYPVGKPDGDKVARSCLDAITDSGLWTDDAQASRIFVDKRWAQDHDRPAGAHIFITERT